ncbi:hypothetical protein FAM09_11455 [Niastella caeni]|uniref:Uncharacterized protein n=1 Tax=Niastella caeni TaxID=2569763 RepID=A0A4S8HXU4_9BACT|nr:hypothetical protein [Niastella caeni]THU40470.1 hypothetical protein FAM09_11455 [Niastella caeni]
MKKHLFPLIALILGIAGSSFTTKSCIDIYFIYISGAQNVRSNYTQTSTAQSTVVGTAILIWIRICDDNGTVTDTEFNDAFEFMDVTNDSLNTLDDDEEGEESYNGREYQIEKGEE